MSCQKKEMSKLAIVFCICAFLSAGCGGGPGASSLGTVGAPPGGNVAPVPLEDVQDGVYTASYQSPVMGGGNYSASFSFTLERSDNGIIQLTDWSSQHYVSTTDQGSIRCYGSLTHDNESDLSIDLPSGEFSITMSGGSSADIVITSATEAQATLTLYAGTCDNPMTVYTTATR